MGHGGFWSFAGFRISLSALRPTLLHSQDERKNLLDARADVHRRLLSLGISHRLYRFLRESGKGFCAERPKFRQKVAAVIHEGSCRGFEEWTQALLLLTQPQAGVRFSFRACRGPGFVPLGSLAESSPPSSSRYFGFYFYFYIPIQQSPNRPKSF